MRSWIKRMHDLSWFYHSSPWDLSNILLGTLWSYEWLLLYPKSFFQAPAICFQRDTPFYWPYYHIWIQRPSTGHGTCTENHFTLLHKEMTSTRCSESPKKQYNFMFIYCGNFSSVPNLAISDGLGLAVSSGLSLAVSSRLYHQKEHIRKKYRKSSILHYNSYEKRTIKTQNGNYMK